MDATYLHRTSLTTVLLLAGALTLSGATLAEIYKVVDDQGNVTFTDSPPSDSKANPVSLPPANTQPAMEITPPPEEPAETNTDKPVAYDKVVIVQPKNDATVPPGQLTQIVQVKTSPTLQAGHRLRIMLDGKPVAPPSATSSIVLDDLLRGAHQLEAQVLNEEDRIVARSVPVTFYVHRASRLINPGKK